MEDTARFTIGSEVVCTDGIGGDLTRVVVDPVARAVTHLVVEPKNRRGRARLVPVGLIEATTTQVQLRCTVEEFTKLDDAEETQFFPGTSGDWGYDDGEVMSWPYYSMMSLGELWGGSVIEPVVHDRVPLGEVEVRRGENVHATDGAIGKVQGLVIDPRDHHVTHVLLQEGHLWGRKEVAIPIVDVSSVVHGIHLRISKREVQDLPAVELEGPGGDAPTGTAS